jgi:nuclear pore complex protein Nup155
MGIQQSNVSDTTLAVVQKNLYLLKDFLDRNPQLFHSSPADLVASRPGTGNEQDAWKVGNFVFLHVGTDLWKMLQAEQNSVSQLLSLLARTIEAISFFLLLHDYRLGELIAQLDLIFTAHFARLEICFRCELNVQKLVTSLTFEDLITAASGQSVSRALVNVVIDQQIGQQISVRPAP